MTDTTASMAAPITKEAVFQEMAARNWHIGPEYHVIADHDPAFLAAYNRFAGLALLRPGFDDGEHALPAKYREVIACVLLACLGNPQFVANHARQALQHGATEQELVEALEVLMMVAGSAPVFTALHALVAIREERTTTA